MALSDLTSRDAVLDAIREYDRIGREAFLSKYGFTKALNYFLVVDGRRYDSKAVAGAAYGYQFPAEGPLLASKFSGGERTVKTKLEALGFIVEVVNAPTSWLFQYNPAKNDIERSISERSEMTWVVNQSKNEIKSGHKVYIWESGALGGIIAAGTILSDPKLMPEDPGMAQFMKAGYKFVGDNMRVRLRIERNLLANRIGRSQIKADSELKQLMVLKFANATNYALSEAQVRAIEALVSSGTECVENLGVDAVLPTDERPTADDLKEITIASEALRTPDEVNALLAQLQEKLKDKDVKRRRRIANAIVRTPRIAKLVKEREGYRCQKCNVDGFEKKSGGKYAEVHHVDELARGGRDLPNNMVCVCASCHRKIHYGI